MLYFTEYDSPLGKITMVGDADAVTGLWFEAHRYMDEALDEVPVRNDDDAVLRHLSDWLDAYFASKRPAIDELPLAPKGSEFRQDVWQVLRTIPYGEIMTYGEVAEEVRRAGGKASPRCVGGAVGHNPISIVIPCHRVVGSSGSLTGFGGGIGRKVALLEHEGVDMSRFFVPKRGTAL